MKSIAVTKPDMGVLSQDRLLLSPFGALSQAFGEELLARAEQTEGAWSYVPLELLEEGEEAAPPAPPVKPVLQVNLQLVLEALRREGRRTEQQRATERIVERILQMQDRPASRQEKEKSPARTPAQSLSVFGTVRQEFHPTFIQNIRISAPPPSQPKPMGELARKAENLSQRLQTLREEGAHPTQETRLAQGQMVPLHPHEEAPRFTRQVEQVSSRPLPQEALTLLEEQGDEAAQTVSRVQGKELLRQADQLAHQVEKVLTESAKSVANPPASAGKHQEPDTSNQSRRTPQREGAEKKRGESGKQGKKTASQAPAAQGTSVPHGVSHTTPGETAARDIRVSPDTPLGSAAAQEHFGVTAKQQTMEQMGAAPMVPGTSMVPGQMPGAPAVSGQGAVPPAPLDLSLRAEGEKAEEAGRISHKVSPTVEKTETAEGKRPSLPASAQEKAADASAQPQTTETAKTAQTTQTVARDIRVSPEIPLSGVAAQEYFEAAAKQQAMGQMGAAPMVPGTSMVPGQMPGAPAVSGQGAVPPAPLDLSLRAEGEKAEEVGRISHKASPTVEKTGAAEGKRPSPPALAQEKTFHSNVQPQGPQTAKTAQTTQTVARDIRVSPDTPLGSAAVQEHFGVTAKQQTMGQGSAAPMAAGTSMGPGQLSGATAVSGQGAIPPAPLNLSLRTEGEKVEEMGQISHKVSPTVEKTGTAEGKRPSPPALAQEKAADASAQPQTAKTAQTTQTVARDIRVSPEIPLSGVAAQEYFEAAAKQQAMGQMGTTPMVPGTSMVPGQMPGAPVVSGQGAVPPAPLDLSLRAEGEKADEVGQISRKVSPTMEKTGTAEGKRSSPPASAQEKTSHFNVQPQGTQTAKTAQTATRDIRVSPEIPLSGVATQKYFEATAKQQAMGQMGTTPMVPGTSMVPGQMPGAPVVSGQGAVSPAPLDLSLRTEGEKEEKAGQISHKASPTVEKTGAAKSKQPSPPASDQEKTSHSNIQSQTPPAPQTDKTARTPQTAVRDIRVSPDTTLGSAAVQERFGEPGTRTVGQMGAAPIAPGSPIAPGAPMVPGTSMVPGQMPGAPVVSGQGALPLAPLDLTLRTEGEKTEEMGQASHRASSAVEKRDATKGKQSSPPASAQEKTSHSNVQPQGTQTAKTAQTAARDIRVSPEIPLGSIAAQEYFGAVAKQQAMGQMGTTPMVPGTSMVPGQIPGAPAVSEQGAVPPAPLDLSLRTEGENLETVGQTFHKTSSTMEKTGTTEGRPSSSPASVREQADHSNIQPQMTRTSQAAATGRQTAQSPQTSRVGTQNHPSPWGPRTAARDIRTGPALGHTVSDGKGAEAWMVPSLPLTWSQPHQEKPAVQPHAAGQVQAGAQAAAAAQRGTSSMAEPLSLTYGPVQGSTETPPPEPEATQPASGEESEFVRSLPDWARRFLKQSRSSSASHAMGVARDIATVPMPEETEDVQWTAPNYRPPQATIAHREKKQEERPKAVQEVRISEAEIQRTADRVYRIIEDRIRLERRRLGL